MEQLLNLFPQGSVFTPRSCVCYAYIKAQGIFPANYPSEPVTLTWDVLFRLGIGVFQPMWLFLAVKLLTVRAPTGAKVPCCRPFHLELD